MHKNIMKTYFSVSAQNSELHARILTASRFDKSRIGINRIAKIMN